MTSSYTSSTSSPSSLRNHSLPRDDRLRGQKNFSAGTRRSSCFDSDSSTEGTSEMPIEQQDVNVLMGETLFYLRRITEHLREKDSNGAANEIAKNTISILNIFNDAIADWDIDKCLMDPTLVRLALQRQEDENLTPTTAVRLGPSGLVQGVAGRRHGQTNGEHVKKVRAGSWASVAATATHQGNRIVKFRPADAITRKITEDSMTPVRPQDARVIWIKPWNPEKNLLSDITEKIDQGPLFSIAYSQPDEAVCVIFQHAHHARAFLEANARHSRTYGQGLFGTDSEVLEGQAYPATEDIRRMDVKNERRRLTFARCRLFTNGLTETRFKTDIFGMVGEGNVELVWLFNSGNATVVFSATAIARTVREEFLRMAACPGVYQDVMVSFSHDPCERPLNLITQMPGSRNSSGARPSNAHVSTNASGTFSRPSQGPVTDAEGWQTVGKRR